MAGCAPKSGLVMRGLFSAIVDEADHALIDDAVTPLIISRKQPNPSLQAACVAAGAISDSLQRGVDYSADPQFQEILLLAAGETKVSQAHLDGIWSGPGRRRELIGQALQAREFFHRGHQYLIAEGKVVIVDESTGRQMPQRTWRGGLHQAIEAKEGLKITDPSETLARLSFQRFFRFFEHLAGVTGTAREAAGEFWQIYGLPIVAIPTHRPCIREQWPDRLFTRGAEKWRAVAQEIERLRRLGRPILAGTRSIAASEHLAGLLDERRLPHSVLNAEQFEEEASIIARAGERGRITIATNMAGRGTDIRLGSGVSELGGLHVIATEKHESRRVDRQLFGRAGRQGDPGSAQAFASLDDELLKHAPAWLRARARTALGAGWPAAIRVAGRVVAHAQKRAGRRAAAQRRRLLEQDLSLDENLAFAGAEI
jgi:preprotein translocase subunit SecA